jgi:hypothetical protein
MKNNDFDKLLEKLREIADDEIKNYAINLETLWLLQYEDQTHGPFDFDDICESMDEFSGILSKCLICNFQRKDWKPFFNHREFQRRRTESSINPKPFRFQETISNMYYLLSNGQKQGPFDEEEIMEMVQSGEVKMNVLISSDKGRTWRKIYHFEKFDRRKDKKKKKKNLNIEKPDENQFEKSKIYTSQLMNQLHEKESNESDIKSAIELCQNHRKKKEKDYVKQLNNNMRDTEKSWGPKAIRVAVIALCLLSIPYFLIDNDQKKNTTESPIQNIFNKLRGKKPAQRIPAQNNVQKPEQKTNDVIQKRFDNDHLHINSEPSRKRGRTDRIDNFKRRDIDSDELDERERAVRRKKRKNKKRNRYRDLPNDSDIFDDERDRRVEELEDNIEDDEAALSDEEFEDEDEGRELSSDEYYDEEDEYRE